ncbi:MAG TPA: hypothetical protein VN812_08530 [Candidatus Acidoferrales bacterium]|nr:hypothetical protein [Candidatus Acidoferrales bacterium]
MRVGVLVAVDVRATVALAVKDGVRVAVLVTVCVGLSVAVRVGIDVAVAVNVDVADGVCVPVAVRVGVAATTVAMNVTVAAVVGDGCMGVTVGDAMNAASSSTSAGRSAAVVRPSPLASVPAQLLGAKIAVTTAATSVPLRTPLQSASPGSVSAAAPTAPRHTQPITATSQQPMDRNCRGTERLYNMRVLESAPDIRFFTSCHVTYVSIHKLTTC